ncbi:50S ribosomal protein L10 [Patescibacteria group bacterium]
MPQTREQKQQTVEVLKEKIKKQKAIIFVDFTGLKVKNLTGLRNDLKASESEFKVAKRNLIEIALKESKVDINLEELKGEIALVFGYKDQISPSKMVWQFSKKNQNLKILGGFSENKFLKSEEIIELAKLPSREELLARLVGSTKAPISGFVNVLQGNLRNLVYILSQISNKGQSI